MNQFLYIKQHKVTGKLYFGKTTKNPLKYNGSGLYWSRHLKSHGKDIETLWYCLFTDQEECTKFALMFSEQEDIVNSDLWLNLIFENALNGLPDGYKPSLETRQKLSLANFGKLRSHETKSKMSLSFKGRVISDETRQKLSLANTGKHLSDETKAKMSISLKGRITSHEHRKKLSIAALNFSPEQRSRQIESVKIKSKETKQKMKISALNRNPSHNMKIGAAHKGIPKTASQKLLISISLKAIPKITCTHCGLIGSPSNMKRWHGDNCKFKII